MDVLNFTPEEYENSNAKVFYKSRVVAWKCNTNLIILKFLFVFVVKQRVYKFNNIIFTVFYP
jgi:hypothetical protein